MKDQKKEKCHDESEAQEKTVPGAEQEQIVNEPQNNESGEKTEEHEPVSKDNPEDKIAELNDKYLRLAAEFDNYRRRTAKERLDLVLTAAEDTIKGLLPVLDDCERAIDVLKSSEGDHKAAIEGTELIYNKLYSYLESKGLKKIEVKGKELDTDFHEAVAQFPAPDKKHKNKIVDVAQHGYTLNGKVIRFAKVVVGI
ncbi:MAG: nucleotide exchange factor GrpE [Rikenellaceae bacterium]|nr:nucleotide exchange factor GrpE [Rikenellaceae bacterium]